MKVRQHSVLPGFGLTMGVTLLYGGLVVMLPLAALVLRTANDGWASFVQVATDPRVLAACRLSFGASWIAASINAVFGLLVAWVLVRYEFPGRRLVDAMVDLPFALPTAVSGIALTTVWAPKGWIGRWLHPHGLDVAFTRAGVVVALTLIGLPFVVRALQPALEELEIELEEVSACLGASRAQIFLRVILPTIAPSLLAGFTMALARAIGEYGSVVFIAGNRPMSTEIAPLLVIMKLEQYDYAGATAIAVLMLAVSFGLLLAINAAQALQRRRAGA